MLLRAHIPFSSLTSFFNPYKNAYALYCLLNVAIIARAEAVRAYVIRLAGTWYPLLYTNPGVTA